MEERVKQLEVRVAELAEHLRRVEQSLAAVQAARPAAALPARAEARDADDEVADFPSAPPGVSLVGVLSLAGRTFLVLGGAFLIRALTEAGTLPHGAGVAVGLLFGLAWIAFAHSAAARGETLSAGFHGVTSAIIGYPLLWEAQARLAVLTPPAAAAAVAFFTLASLVVAWRHSMQTLAWTALGSALLTLTVLLFATGAVGACGAALLVLAACAVWLDDCRGWVGLRWPIAFVVDLALLRLGYQYAPGNVTQPPPLGAAFALVMALPIVYLGGLALRSLHRRLPVGVFEVIQIGVALEVGLGGAVRIAAATGATTLPFGVISLALALGAFAVAFFVVEKRAPRGRDFLFYSTLGLILTLAGSELVTGSRLLAVFWCVLAVAAAAAGGRFGRLTMWSHATIYLWAAALQSGLASTALDGFLAAPDHPWAPVTITGLVVLAAAAVAGAMVFFIDRAPVESWRSRLPRAFLALLVAWCAGGLVVALVAGALGHPDPATLAVIRTVVLAVAALALAVGRRWGSLTEFAWLSYLVLVAGGFKMLIEDLPHGRPATLVAAFALYGVALIVAPRLARDRQQAPAATGAPQTRAPA